MRVIKLQKKSLKFIVLIWQIFSNLARFLCIINVGNVRLLLPTIKKAANGMQRSHAHKTSDPWLSKGGNDIK